ncbi:hypothetical protein CALVIDRAFT_582863 [Calocera viscosa TUFC12733]|uniref:Uncharacterized protein n=1 Tax=Calocera viscosa (strain TUFC12733) TaxID=1330018 RepID=A0A167JDF3_CALVF|nr:hypothetical protein CALVIDRAFT_582863 [Calocera viscosa TUFC12733]
MPRVYARSRQIGACTGRLSQYGTNTACTAACIVQQILSGRAGRINTTHFAPPGRGDRAILESRSRDPFAGLYFNPPLLPAAIRNPHSSASPCARSTHYNPLTSYCYSFAQPKSREASQHKKEGSGKGCYASLSHAPCSRKGPIQALRSTFAPLHRPPAISYRLSIFAHLCHHQFIGLIAQSLQSPTSSPSPASSSLLALAVLLLRAALACSPCLPRSASSPRSLRPLAADVHGHPLRVHLNPLPPPQPPRARRAHPTPNPLPIPRPARLPLRTRGVHHRLPRRGDPPLPRRPRPRAKRSRLPRLPPLRRHPLQHIPPRMRSDPRRTPTRIRNRPITHLSSIQTRRALHPAPMEQAHARPPARPPGTLVPRREMAHSRRTNPHLPARHHRAHPASDGARPGKRHRHPLAGNSPLHDVPLQALPRMRRLRTPYRQLPPPRSHERVPVPGNGHAARAPDVLHRHKGLLPPPSPLPLHAHRACPPMRPARAARGPASQPSQHRSGNGRPPPLPSPGHALPTPPHPPAGRRLRQHRIPRPRLIRATRPPLTPAPAPRASLERFHAPLLRADIPLLRPDPHSPALSPAHHTRRRPPLPVPDAGAARPPTQMHVPPLRF